MNWHNKLLIRKLFALLVSILLTIIFVVLFICAIEYDNGVGIFAFLSLFWGFITFMSFKDFLEESKNQKEASNSDLMFEFKNIYKYSSYEEMMISFNLQKNNPLYQDDKIFITNEFLVKKKDEKIFILNGVLDVVPFIHKTNFVIDYVSVIFLYCDGKRYEIKYRRPFGISNMQEKANNVNLAANIIASKSANFRKYPSYILMER